MATYTDNFGLVKSAYGEKADVAVINGNMDTIDGIMHSNRTMLAPAFSQTEDYAVGDVVVYEGNLYRFIVPHSAGNWDGTEVEQTTLGEEVSTKGGADVTKTASGNPIEITDGASAPLVKCVTQITGSQDLHGYDKPWVGGAGKNKYGNGDQTFTQAKQNIALLTPLSAGTYVFGALVESSDTDNTDCLIQLVDSGGAILASGRISRGVTNRTYLVLSWSGNDAVKLNLYAAASYVNGAGDTASFTDIQIESGSTATTYEPYSNICPISGYSSVGVNVSNGGVDVYDSEGTEGNNSNSLIEIISKDSFRVYNTRNQTYASSKQNISVYNLVVGKTYTIEADVTISSGVGLLSVRNSSSQVLTPLSLITQNGHYKVTFVATAEMSKLSFFCTYDTSTTGDVTYSNIRLYEGSELKEYTISLGDTYYSGQIDAVKGVLVADKAEFICDGTESGWGKSTTTECDVYMASSPFSAFNFDNVYMTDKFAYSPERNYNTVGYTWRGSSNKQVRIGFAEYNTSTLADFKTWLGNNPLQIVADLETPIEIPLTPTVISSLLGTNTMWTDGDNLEVEYITEEFQPLVDLIESGNGHTYSTSEQIVGKWTDGKDIYERVFDWSSDPINIPAGGWSNTPILTADIDNIISIRGISPTKTMWNNLASAVDSGTYVTILKRTRDVFRSFM